MPYDFLKGVFHLPNETLKQQRNMKFAKFVAYSSILVSYPANCEFDEANDEATKPIAIIKVIAFRTSIVIISSMYLWKINSGLDSAT